MYIICIYIYIYVYIYIYILHIYIYYIMHTLLNCYLATTLDMGEICVHDYIYMFAL